MTSKHLFFSPLTIDAFLITKHYFDFTLAYPRNVKVQFKYKYKHVFVGTEE